MDQVSYAVAGDADANPTGATCDHVAAPFTVGGPADACEDCLREGTQWVHLRQCLGCGGTRCCDNSPRQHATNHFRSVGHPVMRSAQPGEDWAWCYPDELFLLPA